MPCLKSIFSKLNSLSQKPGKCVSESLKKVFFYYYLSKGGGIYLNSFDKKST